MGCLFPCFRARAAQSTTNSRGDSRGHESKKNRLSDLFLSEEEKAPPSPCIHTDKDLNDEAQFLKASCTTPATPVKIRKAPENLETPQRGKQFTSSQFGSWISSNSDAVFHLDEKTPEPCGEEVSEQTPSSCITDSQTSTKISIGNTDAGEESQGSIGTASRDGVDRTIKVPLRAENITGKIKSVRFECDFDQSYSSSSSKNTNSKIPEKAGEITLSVACEGKLEDSSASISHWVKQSEEKSNNNMGSLSTITYRDRPIIGMVAAHWNEKEQSQISPKWWDGNGIPNSTNKYKEDQKVSWHATPFEERLEKALSEEGGQGFISSRKLEVMEDKERDTAISQLHHSAQSTSIVSF
ncbi:unnamed protein product [Brassica napus]|uniref:(rape) hypothetical protein n=1 Tax=Brassica napus TaxID=3708 RepID=A0A816VBN2_BRANA|nr:unnamed protein product [Brassica napus]